MAEGDFSVYAKIQADTSNFEKGMKKAQTSANNLSNTFGNLSKVINKALGFTGLAVGTKALVDFGKTAVKSGNQATKTFAVLNNTIKATGADAWTSAKELEGMAKTLSNETNYSVTELEKMQSVLLGFRDITGETFGDASEAILDMATVMGMDLTSAVQTVGKALDDPIKGLDSLRRQGFAFTDEQKAELAQLVKTGDKIKAQKIILDELSRTYGGASKAGQDSFAKQKHAAENFMDTLGGKLLPLVKSFSEDNATALNSLTKLIEDIDFNKIGAVVKVTFDAIKNTIGNVFNDIKSIAGELKNFISGMDFSPAISSLETFLEIISKIISAVKGEFQNVTKAMADLKESLADMTAKIDFKKLENAVNIAISAVVFLYTESSKVFDTLLDNIKTFVKNVWNQIKSLFESSKQALADSEGDIKSWSDFFYNIFNNFFKTAQDLIQSISALLRGDWKLAWEYFKLAVFRTLKAVTDSISAFVNAFPKAFQKIIDTINNIVDVLNDAKKIFHIPGKEIQKISDLKPVNFSEKLGLDDAIDKSEKMIETLTGAKPGEKNLKDLNKFVSGSQNILGKFVDKFKQATDDAKKELDNLSGDFKATVGDLSGGDTSGAENAYKQFTEWDAKLLQQRLDNLDEWQDEYHKVSLDLIEIERQRAKDADTTGAETKKINAYYDQKIVEENKRAEEEKRNHSRETVSKIIAGMKEVASKTAKVFKTVVSTIKNAFTAIASFAKNAFNTIKDIFSSLFKFDPDDALESLLDVEDAILTFFVETLPKLPSFFESALSSIGVLVQTLMNSIDWEQIKEILTSIVDSFVTYAPEIITGIIDLFSKIVSTISDVLVEKAPEMVNLFGNLFFSIIEALPGIISDFLKVFNTYVLEIGNFIIDNGDKLAEDISNVIKSIVDGISEFIEGGGWKTLLDAILTIQKALETAVMDNMGTLVDAIVEGLPDFVNFFTESITSAAKNISAIIKPLIKLIMAIVEALADILLSDEVMDAGLEVGSALIEGIIGELIPKIIKLLPKLLLKIVKSLITLIPKTVTSIVKGIVNGFIKTDWIQVIKDIFTGFVDAFKDFFGIHSPSTLFESFGEFMMEGLWEGLRNLGEWLKENVLSFFSNLWDGIKNVFGNVGDWFKDTFSTVGEKISEGAGNLGEWASDRWSDIKSGFKDMNEWFGNVFSTAWEYAKSGFEAVGDWASGIWTNIKNGFSNMGDWFKTTFSNGWAKAKEGFSAVTTWASGVWSNIKSGFSSVGTWFSTTFTGAWGKVKDAFSGAKTWFTNLFDGIKSLATSFGSSLGSKLSDAASKIKDTASTAFSNVVSGIKGLGSKVASFFGFANGTNDAPRGLALVGEAGPELVRFNGGEQVINNRNTQKLLADSGKGGSVFNVTFNNTQDTTAFTMMKQLKQYQRNLAFSGVL